MTRADRPDVSAAMFRAGRRLLQHANIIDPGSGVDGFDHVVERQRRHAYCR